MISLGNKTYEVIDTHCHIYPEKIAARATAATDAFYGVKSFSSTCDGAGIVSHLLSIGESDGVDKFLVQSVASTPHQVESINNFIAGEVNKHPESLIGFGALHPESADIRADVRHLKELGLRGVKLHPDIQDFKIDDARYLKIYEICEEEGLPILMHTGDSRYDRSNPNRLLPILEIYDHLTVIGAHLGGYSVWDDAVAALAGMKNLYVDTSSSLTSMPREKAREIIKKYGIDRVLFATDYPMWRARDEIKMLLEMNFSDEEYRKIFSENARRLLSI